jgi:tetraacyldisaccharide 4'-kinase
MVHWIWYSRAPGAALARAILSPVSWLFAGASSLRGALYDRGIRRSHASPIPVVSIGNLTVGGTGKTPLAAWFARRLADAGAAPAVVMRGYGADEPLVHAVINPDVPVVVDPDRVRGVSTASDRGARVAVLDDAFQHRRIQRLVDVVLVSADRWPPSVRRLPAGPFREPMTSLSRASLVVITAKAATPLEIDIVSDFARAAAAGVPQAVVRLVPGELRRLGTAAAKPLTGLRGASVLLISAVADPDALASQLELLGSRLEHRAFRDHHAFSRTEAEALARQGQSFDLVVCTLKDAVKLHPHWPPGKPALWYISQEVILERGREELDRLIETLLRQTAAASPDMG